MLCSIPSSSAQFFFIYITQFTNEINAVMDIAKFMDLPSLHLLKVINPVLEQKEFSWMHT